MTNQEPFYPPPPRSGWVIVYMFAAYALAGLGILAWWLL